MFYMSIVISTNDFVALQLLQEDKGYEEWGHRSLKQEGMSMSMPNMVVLSEDIELDEFESTIVGGGEATPGSRPYIVYLGGGGKLVNGGYCGGSLITPNVVLTAAHCIINDDGSLRLVQWVEFNRHNLTEENEPGAVRMSVGPADNVPNPAYSNATVYDVDVALIFLPHPVSWITPVTLNENSKVPATGAPLDVAGWGTTAWDNTTNPPQAKDPSPVLKETTLNYITNEQCTSPPNLYPPSYVTNNMMCVSHAAGTAECAGDSGMFFTLHHWLLWRVLSNFLNSIQVAL